MKVPLNWLSDYIKLNHTPEEFGKIMTDLEFMQDGPIVEVNGQKVIEIEVRQNRPDLLSIIGVAREYAAYIDSNITEAKKLENSEIKVEWGSPDQNLKVDEPEIVKRFCSVELSNVKIKQSPNWLRNNLEAYGINTINNVVDITNYVMLEYGMPLHAFDFNKLTKKDGSPLLTLRLATNGEVFKTWQNTSLKLSEEDLVISDNEKPVALAGIIGGANSDIDEQTTHIILESACYNQAVIRKTSQKHGIRTEASSRHEKFLNPSMVTAAILRALYLLTDLTEAKIVAIEDHNINENQEKRIIEFNTNEITRLGGVELDIDLTISLLRRFGFQVIDHIQEIGISKSSLTVLVPNWRTDITNNADLVEEVLRLWGYENIEVRPISSTPPEFKTPNLILLESKLKNILVELGLYEQQTSPLVKANPKNTKQIKIENPLNVENEALRTTISETLSPIIEYYKKSGKSKFGLFEAGKIFYLKKENDFYEEKVIEVLYSGYTFESKIKPDLLALFNRIGVREADLNWKLDDKKLEYFIEKIPVATLTKNGFTIYTEELANIVSADDIPALNIKTDYVQRIREDISLVIDNNQALGEVADAIKSASSYVKDVVVKVTFSDDKLGNDKKSVTLGIDFEDMENLLTRQKIEEIKSNFLSILKKNYKIPLKDI